LQPEALGFATGGTNAVRCQTLSNSDDVQFISNNASNVWRASGDVELESKPTWGTSLTSSVLYALPQSEQQSFSARIANNGTATIADKNADFIESVTRVNDGWVTIAFKAGFFSQTPVVLATAASRDRNSNVSHTHTYSKDTVTIVTDIADSGVDEDGPFNISVDRQGADARAPGVYVGTVARNQTMYIWDEKAYNAHGGTSSSASYHTRDLNTTGGDILATISVNKVYPQAGTYKIKASAPAYRPEQHHLALSLNGTIVKYGTSEYARTAQEAQTRSFVKHTLEISSGDYIEFEHYIASGDTNGLGIGTGYAGPPAADSIFTTVELIKIR